MKTNHTNFQILANSADQLSAAKNEKQDLTMQLLFTTRKTSIYILKDNMQFRRKWFDLLEKINPLDFSGHLVAKSF